MFHNLRLRLTLLYLAATLTLLVLVGGGTYQLVGSYFQTTTDLALQHKMAHVFEQLNSAVPTELAAAEHDWLTSRTRLSVHPAAARSAPDAVDTDAHNSVDRANEELFDGELAAIFILPIDSAGHLIPDPASPKPPLVPDQAALAVALAHGSDLRTVTLHSGTRARLLTYRLAGKDGPIAVQIGRTLGDQESVLAHLFEGLLALGAMSVLVIGASSWWLSGRSLRPAQQALVQQQTFVANASHELRTPLTLMRAGAEVVQRGQPAGAASRLILEDVLAECDHMNQLIEYLLLLSRLDNGRVALARQHIALADLFADVQRQFGRVAVQQAIDLRADTTDVAVWGDSVQLRQVLLILLDNALRHTPPGGTVHITAQPAAHTVAISVIDTGCGIPKEHVPHVFERFYRVKSPQAADGAGLGLSIGKGLIEAQQGQITIESEVGHGTAVKLILPRAPAAVTRIRHA